MTNATTNATTNVNTAPAPAPAPTPAPTPTPTPAPAPSKRKALSRRSLIMVFVSAVMLITLLIVTPAAFFGSISKEWQLRGEIKTVAQALDVHAAKDELSEIAKSARIVDILAIDRDGKVIYSLNSTPASPTAFSDPNATVRYDSQTGLIKFDGNRVSYFERNSVLGALLNVGDDDFDDMFDDDDDDDRIPGFDYRFVKDNTYQTIELRDSIAGNTVYIVCSQSYHTSFITFLVVTILMWSAFVLLLIITQTLAIADNAKKHGNNTLMWTLISLATPLIGILIYLIYRSFTPTPLP